MLKLNNDANLRGGGHPQNLLLKGFSSAQSFEGAKILRKACRPAFTLAEVLITLGIIGIVAAMTLPSLINKAEKVILKNQFKKSYANLENALNLAQSENGVSECYLMGVGAYYSKDCKAFWPNVLSKLNVLRVCKYSSNGCNPNYKTKAEVVAEGGTIDNSSCSLTNALGNFNVYTLYDGSYLIINDASDDSIYSQWLLIDVNGQKGPNKWGYDIFWTSLYTKDPKKNVILYDPICKMKEKGGLYFSEIILK